jgi:hypothetical protein
VKSVKPRFELSRNADSGLARKYLRDCHTAAFGGVNKHHGCGYIAATAAASGKHAKKKTTSTTARGSLMVSVSNAIGPESSASPDAELEAR